MNAIDILILNSFSAAFDLKYVIRDFKLLLYVYLGFTVLNPTLLKYGRILFSNLDSKIVSF